MKDFDQKSAIEGAWKAIASKFAASIINRAIDDYEKGYASGMSKETQRVWLKAQGKVFTFCAQALGMSNNTLAEKLEKVYARLDAGGVKKVRSIN